MLLAPLHPTCPTCRSPLSAGPLAGICPRCAWPEPTAAEDGELPPGVLFRVPGHDVIAEIARGGGGIVYRARQHQPQREVALKMLSPMLLGSPELLARFRLEAEAIASLHHPSILPIYLVAEHDGLPFFTMKLAAQGTLTAKRGEFRGRWREIATLVASLAQAVHHAHTHGVVHRDLKPGNVLFDEAGQPYVSDFGLAKITSGAPTMTRAQAVMGTPAYLAPEVVAQGAGSATTASDVYGLGTILYELLAGSPPFAAESIPALLRQVSSDLPARPSGRVAGVPRDLEVICLRCLEKDPDRRLPTAAALAEDLQRWLDHRPVLSRPAGAGEHFARWARRNPAIAAVSGLLVVSLAAGGIIQARNNERLRAALARMQTAELATAETLHESLVAQARLVRQSGRVGQRLEALKLLERAATLRSSPLVGPEIVAALARPDLRYERPLPSSFVNEAGTIAVTRDFQSYLTATPSGEFQLRRIADASVVQTYRSNQAGMPLRFALNADGTWFLVRFTDGRVEAWAHDGSVPAWSIAPRGPAAAVGAIHPHEPIVAGLAPNGAISLRHLRTGANRFLTAAAPPARQLSYSPDGTKLAVLRPDELALLDAESGTEIWHRAANWADLDIAWSPDGLRLAVAEESRGDVSVLHTDSGLVEQVLPCGNVPPRLLAFGPGPRRLATVSAVNELRVWDFAGREVVFQTGLSPRVLAFSPDGRRMVAGKRWLEAGVFAWEPETVFREYSAGQVTRLDCDDLTLSPDGRWVATSDPREVRIWDARAGRQVASFALPGADWTSVRFHPDGKSIITSAMNRGVSRRTFAPAGNGEAPRLGPEEPIGEHRDGRFLSLSTTGDWYVDRESIARVVVWPGGDPAREKPVAESGHWDRSVVSPDGKYVAAMGYPRVNVRVTTVGRDQPAVVLPIQNHAAASFSPDGRWLATGTEADFQFWSLPDLRPLPHWAQPGPGNQWRTPTFSPDGTRVALELQQGAVEIRRTSDLQMVGQLIPPVPIAISQLAWSPDGQSLFLLGYGHRLFEWKLDEIRNGLQARGLDF